jgi:hypothetical protein
MCPGDIFDSSDTVVCCIHIVHDNIRRVVRFEKLCDDVVAKQTTAADYKDRAK